MEYRNAKRGNKSIAIIALILGIISIVAPFTYYLAAFSFLSIAGIVLGIIAWKNKKNSLNKISLAVNAVGVLILIGYICVINYNDFKSSKTIYEYYLPKGYKGWVYIIENNKNALPIPVKPNSIGERYIIVFPPSGQLETSSSLNETHHEKYFWYTKNDTVEFKPETSKWGDADYKTLIHYAGTGSTDNGAFYYHFYVSDVPRNPQDSVILSVEETPFNELNNKLKK